MPRGLFFSLDLKDAYFYFQIAPHQRWFLRFAFEGVAYQLMILPFGLSLAPSTFTKCMALLSFLCSSGPLEGLAVDETGRAPGHDLQKEGSLERRHQLRLGALCDGKPASAPGRRRKVTFISTAWKCWQYGWAFAPFCQTLGDITS